MARRTTHSSSPHRTRNKPNGGVSRYLLATLALGGVILIGIIVWLCTRTTGYSFRRAHLDKYIEMTKIINLLNDRASVYVDMSDGMNFAYSSNGSKMILQAIINKLAANNAIDFFELSDEKITPLELSHTQLYNYMLNSKSYAKQKAPIEKTLANIIDSSQPALLMTDFEEYKGGVIERAAYAKQYFIRWLSKGYNIYFYKWDFNENGKVKHMFLAVFDDNANRLNSLVNTAIATIGIPIDTYVLGGRNFAYPTSSNYLSLKQGGNYHNANGIDAVTAIAENGGPEDYVCYTKPYATASGAPGQFAPLDISLGTFAEYYPIGVKWEDALENAHRMQESGVPQEMRYTHLLRNLFINFSAQDGYQIDDIEVRVFDMYETMQAIANNDTLTIDVLDKINKPEINMILTASMLDDNSLHGGWKEICVDFDEKFNGKLIGGVPSSHILRANIVISKVSPKLEKAVDFFSWDGNPSLANSVKEALTADSTNPQGRILYTYYLKTISD